jgi:hypothetical protein
MMGYVAGSTNLTIFVDELSVLVHPFLQLPTTEVNTANGVVNVSQLELEMRIIADNDTRILRDWHWENAGVVCTKILTNCNSAIIKVSQWTILFV